jgi:hypothetical protein
LKPSKTAQRGAKRSSGLGTEMVWVVFMGTL